MKIDKEEAARRVYPALSLMVRVKELELRVGKLALAMAKDGYDTEHVASELRQLEREIGLFRPAIDNVWDRVAHDVLGPCTQDAYDRWRFKTRFNRWRQQ